jgi:hypothetical protein
MLFASQQVQYLQMYTGGIIIIFALNHYRHIYTAFM